MTRIHQRVAAFTVALVALGANSARADYQSRCASCHTPAGTVANEVNNLVNGTALSGSIRAANNRTYLDTRVTAGMGGFATVANPSGLLSLTAVERNAIVAEIAASSSVAAPVFTSGAAPGGSMTVFYSHTFSASGAPTLVGNAGLSSPFTLVTAGTLPPGVTLTGTTGVLSGTPTLSGTYTGSIRASNLIGAGPTQSFTITISKLTQATLNAFASPSTVTYLGTSTLSTTGGNGIGAVTYSSNNGNCQIVGTTLTAQSGTGSCIITATKATDVNYLQATATVTVTLAKASQATLNAFATPSTVVYPGTSALSSTGGTGTGAVAYSSNSASCTIIGTTLTAQSGTGTCTITATRAADTNYLVATATVLVTLTRATQATLNAFAAPSTVAYLGTSTLSTTGGTGTGAVSYSSNSASCTIVGATLTAQAGAGSCTITATKAADTNYLLATATVGITLTQASQTISFGAQTSPLPFSAGGSFMVAPLATGGGSVNPVIYSSTTGGVCTVSGTTVSMVTPGLCRIAADQAADGNYTAALQVTQDVTIVAVIPGAPGIGSATPGDGQATVAFTTVTSDGGSAILFYTLRCVGPNTLSVSGGGSPLTLTGMTNLSNYACIVFATNAVGDGPDSGTVNVTPSALPPLALMAVVSRKSHGAAGPFEVVINSTTAFGGLVDVEPRVIGGGGHTLVFQFNNPITGAGSVSATVGTASSIASGNDVVVTLIGVPDNSRVMVTLNNVNGVATPFTASLGFLVGDVNGTRSTSASDISGVKARSGQTTTLANFRFDVNATGSISAADISAVKARSGLTLPP